MIDWFFTTLKTYPEIAIFLALALRLLLRQVHLQGHRPRGGDRHPARRRPDRTDRDHHLAAAQGVCRSSCSCSPSATASGRSSSAASPRTACRRRSSRWSSASSAWWPVVVIAKIAGYDLGYAAGLYSGSQTISAAMGLSTDAINRLGMAADQAKALLDSMPVAYAVTYMFGTWARRS